MLNLEFSNWGTSVVQNITLDIQSQKLPNVQDTLPKPLYDKLERINAELRVVDAFTTH